jgi:diguanylate cyclase (GGDEF)-like protein
LSQKSHILIITQSEPDHDILAKILQAYQLNFYKKIQSAETQILHQAPQLIIIDSSFGDASFDFCKNLLHNQSTTSIPIIFIFNQLERDGISTMFNCGGSDYISKPFNQYEVISRVYIHTTYAKQKRELEFLALYDPMTQTYNRRSFFKKANQAITYARNRKRVLYLAVFHISTLVKINDEYGHFTGDKVILECATILKKYLAKENMIGRLNGSDFTVILNNQLKEDIVNLITHINKEIQNIEIGNEKPVLLEHGLAQLIGADETIDDLFLEASMYLEECKIARTTRNY